MKKILKISISFVLAITIVFGSAYVGLGGIDFKSLLLVEASAVSDGGLTYVLNDDGTGYIVTGCDDDIAGEVIIPDTYNSLPVIEIAQNVFRDCTDITSVYIGKNIKEIKEHAFNGCTSLTEVHISDLVAWCNIEFIYIESNPLYSGKNLYLNGELVTELVIPQEITEIRDRAFCGCKSITSVTLHDDIKSIGESAFGGCALERVNISDLTAWCGIEFDGYGGNPLYYSEGLYLNGEKITNLVVPEGTRSISDYAFYEYEELIDITIPDSLERVGYRAFNGTAYYDNEENWTDGVLYIDNHLIKALTSIEGDYVVREGTRTISDKAFYNCGKLISFTIPESVTNIGLSVLEKCAKLECLYWNAINVADFSTISKMLYSAGVDGSGVKVIFGDKVESIPEYAFYVNDYNSWSLIKEVTFGKNVKSIGASSFWGCKGLTSITIPDSVNTIGSYAFGSCTSVKALTIGKGVKRIDFNAFSNCIGLEKIYWNAVSVQDFDILSTAFNGMGTSSDRVEVVFGADVERIPANVFCVSNFIHSLNVTDVTALDSNPIVGDNAFGDCNIVEVNTYCDYYIRDCFDDEVLKLIHGTSGDWVIDTDATCTDTGLMVKKCNACGDVLETEDIPTNDVHTSSDWIIDTPATVSAPGSKHKECTACGETLETVAIAQLKPATPKVATTNEIGGINITWNAVDGAAKYQIYRRQGGSNTWTLVGTTTGTSLLDKNVQSGIYYVYSVRAYNNAGQYSDFVSANTQTRKFMAVPKLKGISNATNGLYITWEPVAGVTNGYRVYRRGAGSTYWTYLGTTKNTYFTDTAVKNNSGEYFRYTVIADGGYHSKFDTTGLYLRRLSNPTLKSATSASAGITVKWTPVNGCLGYYVYRKTADSNWVRVGVVNGANASSYLDKTAKKGVTYTYTVRAVCGSYISYFNSGISCKDKY